MDKMLLKWIGLPLFTPAETLALWDITAPTTIIGSHGPFLFVQQTFPKPLNECLHSRDDDWCHCILQSPRGKPQSLQISVLSNLAPFRRNTFSFSTLWKESIQVSERWCAVSWCRHHKNGDEAHKNHGLCFAENTNISPSLSRMKVLYTTNQMIISKARCIPWTTTIPILFWWIT